MPSVSPARFGVREVRISGFRTLQSLRFSPGPVCALVGAPGAGKSSMLEAIWTLLQEGPPAGGAVRDGLLALSGSLGGEARVDLLAARTPASGAGAGAPAAPALAALFVPAALRAGAIVAEPLVSDAARAAARTLCASEGISAGARATSLVNGFERLCSSGAGGLVVLIEEPELFLRPQAQRYFYRLLRGFAANGNQVIYSTHEPAFLNVARLEELALVERAEGGGTRVIQPEPLDAEESFRALSEIDAERGELFFARVAMLVEGRTEKLSLPFIFSALGFDVDREGVTIVDCGGKANLRLFIRICAAVGLPCVAVHDRDAPPGRRPSRGHAVLNAEIRRLAGPERTVVLAPDFEGVAGLHGHRHKPAQAADLFSRAPAERVPQPLRAAVEKVIALARG